ncbi:MAG: C-terminal binding protein [Spirochaetia bacterium]|jgi:D-3-phosphoglycerate dehydrogenase
MSKFRVIVADDRYGSYSEEEAILSEIGATLEVRNLSSEEEALRLLPSADGIFVNLFPLNRRIIESLARCRVISRYGVGYDNVDVEAATRKGIWVARVPDYCFEDVSDHALGLLLGCVRKIAYKDRLVREGKWNLTKVQPCHRIAGRTLGLIGFGAIARCLLHKVSGFGLARVLTYDPYVDSAEAKKAGAISVDLSTLVGESDYISVHAPLSPETKGLIGEKEVGLMKPSAIIINTSRGPVVDEGAIATALREGRIAAAGLDVFGVEPLPPSSPLRGLDNVILSDHTGWYSEESVGELKTKAAKNVALVLTGGKPLYPVNAV